MLRYRLSPNDYLRVVVDAYSNCLYVKHGQDDAVDYERNVSEAILILKNQFGSQTDENLNRAKNYLKIIAKHDIRAIIRAYNLTNTVVMCVPRSKASFTEKQRFFHKAMSEMVDELRTQNGFDAIQNGIYAIQRVINTKTTHLRNTKNGDMGGDGDSPYPGITRRTCRLCSKIRGKTIVLIDDIYTKTVNIDEDCCQFLYDNGATKVILYTLCKTPGIEN